MWRDRRRGPGPPGGLRGGHETALGPQSQSRNGTVVGYFGGTAWKAADARSSRPCPTSSASRPGPAALRKVDWELTSSYARTAGRTTAAATGVPTSCSMRASATAPWPAVPRPRAHDQRLNSQPLATCCSPSTRYPWPRSSRPGLEAVVGGSSCGPDHEPVCGAQNGRISTALVLIEIQPETTQIGGSMCGPYPRVGHAASPFPISPRVKWS